MCTTCWLMLGRCAGAQGQVARPWNGPVPRFQRTGFMGQPSRDLGQLPGGAAIHHFTDDGR
jgi:hypothetical protein